MANITKRNPIRFTRNTFNLGKTHVIQSLLHNTHLYNTIIYRLPCCSISLSPLSNTLFSGEPHFFSLINSSHTLVVSYTLRFSMSVEGLGASNYAYKSLNT